MVLRTVALQSSDSITRLRRCLSQWARRLTGRDANVGAVAWDWAGPTCVRLRVVVTNGRAVFARLRRSRRQLGGVRELRRRGQLLPMRRVHDGGVYQAHNSDGLLYG